MENLINHIGLVGLGKMGLPLAQNLIDHGFEVTGFDILESNRNTSSEAGVKAVDSLEELVKALPSPPLVWLMVPAGGPVEATIQHLIPILPKEAIVMDGGNSFYKDSIRHWEMLKEHGIHYLDCGTSGGISGARHGVCAMIGGEKHIFDQCAHIFQAIAVTDGWLHTGAPGSGHFVKMVHNGIEYGMMQAIAEGFEVLQQSEFDMDFAAVSKMWNHGSVIRSWLMELAESAFSNDPHLDAIKGIMHSSGEGRWTLETALELGVPTPVIALSLLMRYRSQTEDSFAGKVVAALRHGFGGHAVEKST